jgi:hypothetical protein
MCLASFLLQKLWLEPNSPFNLELLFLLLCFIPLKLGMRWGLWSFSSNHLIMQGFCSKIINICLCLINSASLGFSENKCWQLQVLLSYLGLSKAILLLSLCCFTYEIKIKPKLPLCPPKPMEQKRQFLPALQYSDLKCPKLSSFCLLNNQKRRPKEQKEIHLRKFSVWTPPFYSMGKPGQRWSHFTHIHQHCRSDEYQISKRSWEISK